MNLPWSHPQRDRLQLGAHDKHRNWHRSSMGRLDCGIYPCTYELYNFNIAHSATTFNCSFCSVLDFLTWKSLRYAPRPVYSVAKAFPLMRLWHKYLEHLLHRGFCIIHLSTPHPNTDDDCELDNILQGIKASVDTSEASPQLVASDTPQPTANAIPQPPPNNTPRRTSNNTPRPSIHLSQSEQATSRSGGAMPLSLATNGLNDALNSQAMTLHFTNLLELLQDVMIYSSNGCLFRHTSNNNPLISERPPLMT